MQGHIADSSDLDRLTRTVLHSKGKLDIPVASSHVGEPAALEAVTEDQFDRTFDSNARATAFTAQKALPLMSSGSAVVLIGSGAGSIDVAGYGVYADEPSGNALGCPHLDQDLASRGIRVHTLSPGPIGTPMMARTSKDMRSSLPA